MQHKPEIFNWDNLTKKIDNSRYGEPKVRGANVTARYINTGIVPGENVKIAIKHHYTDIAEIEKISSNVFRLKINNGGYKSATTKHYLNEILGAYSTGVGIFQKDWAWYFTIDGETHDYANNLTFSGSD